MTDTFAALLGDLLRKDPGRPLVTFYDDETGERVELSLTTYANWVAKTSSLLVEVFELERGGRLLVDLPTHWLGPVFLGAAWTVGLTVVPQGEADAIVCGPDTLKTHADGGVPVIACSLRPLGIRFAEALPDGVTDFGVEVWSQPDSFIPWDPARRDDTAVPGISQHELFARALGIIPPGTRLLTTANPATPDGLATFVEPMLAGGSTVWVRNADPGSWQRKYAEERATAMQD